MKTRYVLRFDPGHANRAGRHEIEVKLRSGRNGQGPLPQGILRGIAGALSRFLRSHS